jgi:hypothetical protein
LDDSTDCLERAPAGPDGKQITNSKWTNILQCVAHFSLPMISELAERKDWTLAQFAGAAAFIAAGGQ